MTDQPQWIFTDPEGQEYLLSFWGGTHNDPELSPRIDATRWGMPYRVRRLNPGSPPRSRLCPSERMALTVAHAQVKRGEDPSPNVAAACIVALSRITGGAA